MKGEMTHHKIQKSRKKPTASKRTNREPVVASVPNDPVDRLLIIDPVLVRLSREVRKHQGLLRESCSEEAWRIYLRIEELMNERMFTFADKWVQKNPRSSAYHNHLTNLPLTSRGVE